MESTDPEVSLLITIKRKYIIITRRAGISMSRKKSFDVNTIKTIKTIFCSDPDKPIFILDESMDNAIAETFSIGKSPEIKRGSLGLNMEKNSYMDEKKERYNPPPGNIYYKIAGHYYLKFTKKPGKQKFPVAARIQFPMKCGKIKIKCVREKKI